jgi:hypothetical protein
MADSQRTRTPKNFKDVTGQRFGLLTVLRRDDCTGRVRWICRCDCGTEKSILAGHLFDGKITRCTKHRSPPESFQDFTGHRVGRLLIVQRIDEERKWIPRWLAKCDCGRTTTITSYGIRRGTRSCGCLSGIVAREGHFKHGMSGTSIYGVWHSMVNRCHLPTTKAYANYGGRGIHVCEHWRNSFEAFLADMGERPRPDLTIDRINNDRGYDCGKCDDCKRRNATANCRWADRVTQAKNRRPAQLHHATPPQS